jgi:type IV secretory pathway TraG/TraD family ATPase VirD4
MYSYLGQSKLKGNAYFILDEFPLIPKLNYMDNALNFGRSLGVKVIAGIQNVGQVEYTYTEALAQSLLSGFSTYFAFRLFDEKSRRIVSERHGKNRKKVSLMSSNSFKGLNDSIMDTNVIEDWNITKLGIGECIVSMANEEPFLFYPVRY